MLRGKIKRSRRQKTVREGRVIRRGLSEEVTSEPRPEGSEKGSHVDV